MPFSVSFLSGLILAATLAGAQIVKGQQNPLLRILLARPKMLRLLCRLILARRESSRS